MLISALPPKEVIRPTDSLEDGGVKNDFGKLRWTLLPWDGLEEVVKVLEYGSQKYDARNWEQGMDWSRNPDACLRHFVRWWQFKEDYAPDSGLHHMAHHTCDSLFTLTYILRNRGKDDRP